MTKSPNSILWSEPQSGDKRALAAGQSIVLSFLRTNESSARFKTFVVLVQGVPEGWSLDNAPASVPPKSSDTVQASLRPPIDAALGTVELVLNVECQGEPVDPDAAVRIVLQVEAQPSEPVQLDNTVPTPPKKAPPKSKPPAAQATGPADVSGDTREHLAVDEEKPEPPEVAPPNPQPKRVAKKEEPIVSETIVAPVSERKVRVGSMPIPQQILDKVRTTVYSPKDGQHFHCKPTEFVLVQFPVEDKRRLGERATTQAYTLQDSEDLPKGWLVVTQPDLNLTPGGTGELSVLLQPSKDAPPGPYPFRVQIGQPGSLLRTRSFTLDVMPTPAVKLEVDQTTVSRGPFMNAPKFELTVASSGNADTAYRLTVKDDQASEEDVLSGAASDMSAKDPFRFVFDRELDNLTSQENNKGRAPQKHKLTVERPGIWWFGLREAATFHVAAVPVTDPKNGDKGENVMQLTASRWRILPVHGLIFWPLALLLFLAFGTPPTDLELTTSAFTAYKAGEYDGRGYPLTAIGPLVFADKGGSGYTRSLQFEWKTSVPVPVTLTGRDETSEPVASAGGTLSPSFTGRFMRVWARASSRIPPLRSTPDLLVNLVGRSNRKGILSVSAPGDVLVEREGVERDARLPQDVVQKAWDIYPGALGDSVLNVNLTNTSNTANKATLNYWIVSGLDSARFTFLEPTKEEIEAGGTPDLKLKILESDDEVSELVIVTTDSEAGLLKFYLHSKPRSGGAQ